MLALRVTRVYRSALLLTYGGYITLTRQAEPTQSPQRSSCARPDAGVLAWLKSAARNPGLLTECCTLVLVVCGNDAVLAATAANVLRDVLRHLAVFKGPAKHCERGPLRDEGGRHGWLC